MVTVNVHVRDIDDTEEMIENAITQLQSKCKGSIHVDQLNQAPIHNINEWKEKHDRKRCQIEDNHNWSSGQTSTERFTSDLKQGAEYLEDTHKHKVINTQYYIWICEWLDIHRYIFDF